MAECLPSKQVVAGSSPVSRSTKRGDSSGGKTYHGRITLEGNRWLRWGLIEAVVPASYADAEIRRQLDDLRKIKSGNVVKTIMARRLLKIVFHVLKERKAYVPNYAGRF